MSKHRYQLVLLAPLLVTAVWAADDGLIGKWKLNPSKSTFTDQMKVGSAGGNKYVLDFGGGTRKRSRPTEPTSRGTMERRLPSP